MGVLGDPEKLGIEEGMKYAVVQGAEHQRPPAAVVSSSGAPLPASLKA